MADFLRDFLPLVKLSQNLPATYERCRQLVHEEAIPAKRDENGRLFVRRDFALRLVDVWPDHASLTDAINSIAMPDSDSNISTTVSDLAAQLNVSERRVTDAAKSAKHVVGWQTGMIETTEKGIENLKADLKNQLA
jgi:hypothetical protein